MHQMGCPGAAGTAWRGMAVGSHFGESARCIRWGIPGRRVRVSTTAVGCHQSQSQWTDTSAITPRYGSSAGMRHVTYLTRAERTRDALVMLGQAVRRARTRSALSQRDLEALSGVDQTAISRMERGVAPGMGLDKFARVAAVLVADLLVSEPASPEHRYAPLIPAAWLPPAFGSNQPAAPAAPDASSRLTEVGPSPRAGDPTTVGGRPPRAGDVAARLDMDVVAADPDALVPTGRDARPVSASPRP